MTIREATLKLDLAHSKGCIARKNWDEDLMLTLQDLYILSTMSGETIPKEDLDANDWEVRDMTSATGPPEWQNRPVREWMVG